MAPQRGRGGLAAVIMLVLLVVLAYAGWRFLHEQPPGLSTTISPASAASARQKAESFAEAQARARLSGRPVPVSRTFSDSELSSLANQAAEGKGVPVSDIVLHATGQGTVQGQGQAHVAGQQVPVSFEGVPVVTGGNQLQLNVTNVRVGVVPLPGPITDQVTQAIRQPLAVGQPLAGFQDVHVTTSDGQLTVSGIAQP